MIEHDPVRFRTARAAISSVRPHVFALMALAVLVPASGLATGEAGAASRPAGAGELVLDGPAIAAIVDSGIPEPIPFTVPPFGQITVVLTSPEEVFFRKGGLEAHLGIAVPEIGIRGHVDLRYVPEIDSENAVAMLRPVRCKPGGMLAMVPDLARFMPSVTVPSGFERELHPRGGSRTVIKIEVTEVEVVDQRLVLRLGLQSLPSEKAPKAPKKKS